MPRLNLRTATLGEGCNVSVHGQSLHSPKGRLTISTSTGTSRRVNHGMRTKTVMKMANQNSWALSKASASARNSPFLMS